MTKANVGTAPAPRARRRVIAEAFRSQLWPLPTAAVVLAVVVGVGLPRLDAALGDVVSDDVAGYLFDGGADAARAVLTTIAGSLITVTALTFSLTVVTLQLASSQFSPRLLRTFTSDRIVQSTLALLLATFVYALTVMRTVGSEVGGQAGFVPQLSVTLAYVLTVASVLMLVGFLSHLVRELRVETMLRDVHRVASRTIEATLPPASDEEPAAPVVPAGSAPLIATNSGFLTSVDEAALLEAAVRGRARISIDREPGSSLVAGTPLGRLWAEDGADPLDGERLEQVQEAAARAVRTGVERTAAEDIAYGLRQLTDVAVKALSPGINDPTTAIHALSHSSALLCELAAADPRPRVRSDEQGTVRVVLATPTLADLLDLAISQPRRYGAGDPAVLARLITLLSELAWSSPRPEHRRAVAQQLERLRRTVAEQHFDDVERADLAALASSVEDSLNHRWRP